MPGIDRNIYQIAREVSGLTRERASEVLNLSVRQLARYEAGESPVPIEVVLSMIEIYNTQFLAYQHLRKIAGSSNVLPEIKQVDLPCAILDVQKNLKDALQCIDDLIKIGCDGVVSDSEKVQFNKILAEFKELIASSYRLIFSKRG